MKKINWDGTEKKSILTITEWKVGDGKKTLRTKYFNDSHDNSDENVNK